MNYGRNSCHFYNKTLLENWTRSYDHCSEPSESDAPSGTVALYLASSFYALSLLSTDFHSRVHATTITFCYYQNQSPVPLTFIVTKITYCYKSALWIPYLLRPVAGVICEMMTGSYYVSVQWFPLLMIWNILWCLCSICTHLSYIHTSIPMALGPDVSN